MKCEFRVYFYRCVVVMSTLFWLGVQGKIALRKEIASIDFSIFFSVKHDKNSVKIDMPKLQRKKIPSGML